ncbi:MAG: hypothetical protein ACC614_09320 [Methanobacterium formicicum]|jgi:glycosyltransferase involved in cell wall biosynthesis|uniref:hypothetical protein n=1 Tax=Methanobacterium formicicum TaxID=2162 RepID=UPI00353062E8
MTDYSSDVKQDLEQYQSLKNRALSEFKHGNLEKSLDYTRVAALSAWQHHCGLWYDDDLDYLLEKIGTNLTRDRLLTGNEIGSSDRIVYLTSAVNVGGLTRLLDQWMFFLKKHFKNRVLYITNPYTSPDNFYCTDSTFQDPQLHFYNLSCYKKYTDRVQELIELLIKYPPQQIILFIDPDDVIAISATAAVKNYLKDLNRNMRVIYVNHADHAFWLGKKTIDTLVNFRREGALFSQKYRGMNSWVIPLITGINSVPSSLENIDKNFTEAPSTVSLSVGTFPKVLGKGKVDYFRTITHLLEKYPHHYHFFITNPPEVDILNDYLPDNDEIRKRFVVSGPFSDLTPYYRAADFLIETFPLTGYTVLVEAMTFRLPIVAFKNEKFPLFSSTANLPSYTFTATTQEEIIDLCGRLIENPPLREKLGNQLHRYYLQEMNTERIYSLLKDMISRDTNQENKNNGINDGRNKNNRFENSIPDKEIINNCSYEVDESRVFCENLRPFKQLLLQSFLKKSSFSIKERIEFFSEARGRNEFTKNELCKYVVPVFLGRNYLKLRP